MNFCTPPKFLECLKSSISENVSHTNKVTNIQGFKDTKILKYKDTKIQR
jgi:hypothetical protein